MKQWHVLPEIWDTVKYNYLCIHVWISQKKMNLLKMCVPQIRDCLFTFRPIASKQFNSLTTIVSLSWLGSTEVTHPLWCEKSRVQFLALVRVCFIFLFYYCVLIFFGPKTHFLLQNNAISFAKFIYLVYLTYCKICDRLWGYKDTDLASLNIAYQIRM